VSAQMSGDHVAPAGGVGALRAAVGLLAGVRPLVRAQVVRAREDLTASAARVRFEARMQAHVTRQHVAPGERPLAHVALVAFDDFAAPGAGGASRGGGGGGGGRGDGGALLGFVARCQVFDEAVVGVETLAALLAAEGRRRVADERGGRLGRRVVGRHVRRILGREVLRQRDAPRQQFGSDPRRRLQKIDGRGTAG